MVILRENVGRQAVLLAVIRHFDRFFSVLNSTMKPASLKEVGSLRSCCWCGATDFVAQIPKNPTGKVMRRLLQDKYEAQLASKARL